MILNEFVFGFSFARDVCNGGMAAQDAATILQNYATEGNVFYVNVLPPQLIDRRFLINYGQYTGSRLIEEPLKKYSEEAHLKQLVKINKKVFFITNELPTSGEEETKEKTVIVINKADLSKYQDFFSKKEAIKIRQDMLPSAFKKATESGNLDIEIRDPYLIKEKFLQALIDENVFNKAKIKFHFSVLDSYETEEWMDDATHPKWSSVKKDIYKDQLIHKARHQLASLFLSKPRYKKELKTLLASDRLSVLFYVLKEQYYNPQYYGSDRNGHWHHRFLRIRQNMAKFTFESSHSFIFKKVRDHWRWPGEYLHFRHAKNQEFEEFSHSFDPAIPLKID